MWPAVHCARDQGYVTHQASGPSRTWLAVQHVWGQRLAWHTQGLQDATVRNDQVVHP